MSSVNILKSKLYIPPFKGDMIPREYLISRINQGIENKAVFISAPAGYGKSTLLSEWVSKANLPTAWVSLDHTENDPVIFLSHLVYSVQKLWNGLGEAIFDALNSPGSPSIELLLNSWLNEITEHTSEFIVVLDDFHIVQNDEVVDLLCQIISHQPNQLTFIISSRASLPKSCSRFLARKEIDVLDTSNLRFSEEESCRYLRTQFGDEINLEQSRTLHNRTEGWIVGLHMAVLSMRTSGKISEYINQFSAQNKFITDYLLDEVLDKQTPEVIEFLLSTSVLDKFTPELCNQILGISNSTEIITHLEQEGLFIIPLDPNRVWYRYHHLFSELLRIRLENSNSQIIPHLHNDAAEWYENNNFLEDSVDHIFKTQDPELIILHIEKSINRIIANGLFRQFLSWMEKIDRKDLINKPRLEIVKLFVLHEMGWFSDRDTQLDYVHTLLAPLPEDYSSCSEDFLLNHGIFAAIKSIIYASSYFKVEETFKFEQLATGLLTNTYWDALASGAIPFLHRALGAYNLAISLYSHHLPKVEESGFYFLSFVIYFTLTKCYLETGQLKRALITCQKSVGLDENKDLTFAKLAYMLMAELQYQVSNLQSAEDNLELCLENIIRHGNAFAIIDAYSIIIRIQLANKENDQAISILNELKEIICQLSTSDDVFKIITIWEVYIMIRSGDPAAARTLADSIDFNYPPEKYMFNLDKHSYVGIYRVSQNPVQIYLDLYFLTLARLYLAEKKYDLALKTIEKSIRQPGENGNFKYWIEAQLLKSIIQKKSGNDREAEKSLHLCIQQAAKEGYSQVFIDECQYIRPALQEFLQTNPANIEEQVFILNILEMIKNEWRSEIPSKDQFGEELTKREIEVLIILSTGKSYSEASKDLSISRNTLKAHTRRIYQKLQVKSLLQALNKAKLLGIID